MSTEKTYLTRCPDCKTVHEIRAITYEQSYPRFGAATCPKCKLRYSPKGSAGSYTPSEDAVGKIARARADIAAALEERRIVATLISLGWTPPGDKQAAQAEPVATKLETKQFNCFHVSAEDFERLKALPVGTKLYTEAPAVAQSPADLVRELVLASVQVAKVYRAMRKTLAEKYPQDGWSAEAMTLDTFDAALNKAKEHGL